MANLESDLSDCKAFLHLLHSIDPANQPLDGLNTAFSSERAEHVIKGLEALGLSDAATPQDLVVGDQLINLILLA